MIKLTTADMTPEEKRLAVILALGMNEFTCNFQKRGIPYAHFMTDYLLSRGITVDLSAFDQDNALANQSSSKKTVALHRNPSDNAKDISLKKENAFMLNRTVMMGRLCADPELKQTQSGVPVCSIRIAVDRDYGKDKEKETDFFDVVAWRGTAEFICKYFSRGRMIVAEGRMQTRPWTDRDGNKRVTMELVAENVYFGDSKRENSADDSKGGYSNQAPAPSGGYSGPLPGTVPGDFAPDF